MAEEIDQSVFAEELEPPVAPASKAGRSLLDPVAGTMSSYQATRGSRNEPKPSETKIDFGGSSVPRTDWDPILDGPPPLEAVHPWDNVEAVEGADYKLKAPTLFGAVFQRLNTTANFFSDGSQGGSNDREDAFIARGGSWEQIKGTKYEQYHDAFLGVKNSQRHMAVMHDIDRQVANREIEERNPWYVTMPIQMAATILDPVQILLPGVALPRMAASGAVSVSRALLASSALGAIGGGAQELMLHPFQSIRTREESVEGMVSGALVGALLGGVAGRIVSKGEWNNSVAGINKSLTAARLAETSEMAGVMPRRSSVEEIADAQKVFEALRDDYRTSFPAATDEQVNATAAIQALAFTKAARKMPQREMSAFDFYQEHGPTFVGRGQVTNFDNAVTFHQDGTPALYSMVERAATLVRQESGTGVQFLAAIKNTPGVKQEELDWIPGLEDFLKGKPSVTKKEVIDYIAANKPVLVEVTRGAAPPDRNLEAGIRTWLENRGNVSRGDIDQIARSAVNGERQGVEDLRTLGAPESMITAISRSGIYRQQNPATRFNRPDLVVPGGENYREFLIKKPVGKSIDGVPEGWKLFDDSIVARGQGFQVPVDAVPRWVFQGPGFASRVYKTREEALAALQKEAAGRNEGAFNSSHWPDDPNVLVHIRVNERVIDGKRVFFIEEIQSDWHQLGRKRGYDSASERAKDISELPEGYSIEKRNVKTLTGFHDVWIVKDKDGKTVARDRNELSAKNQVINQINDAAREARGVSGSPVPDAPFKKTWHELALKRMIRQATDEGFDEIRWTAGSVQNERYNLSKHLDRIEYERVPENGTVEVHAYDKQGNRVWEEDEISLERVEEVFGKDIADKIEKDLGSKRDKDGYRDWKTLSGVNLEIGGSGMTGFYDKMLVDAANKLGKPYGAKVEKSFIPGKFEIDQRGSSRFEVIGEDGHGEVLYGPYATRAQAEAMLEKLSVPTHSLPLTPELRYAAQNEGFRMFQGGEADPLGRISFGAGKPIIELLDGANVTTIPHEMAHFWLETYKKFSLAENASEELKSEFASILKMLGVDDASKIERSHHELFARSYERYLAEGKAPTKELEGAFARFREWIADVYKSIHDMVPNLSQEAKDVFDRMLASPEEIAFAKKYMNSPVPTDRPASVGAAALGGHSMGDLTSAGKGTAAVSKLVAWATPADRFYNNPAAYAREVGIKLFDSTRYMMLHTGRWVEENIEGRIVKHFVPPQATAGSVEGRRMYWLGLHQRNMDYSEDRFREYRKSESYKTTGYTREQFFEQVSWASINGDKHAVPEVQRAATFRREHFQNVMMKGQLAENLITRADIEAAARTAESWNHRLYDVEKIEADPKGFEDLHVRKYKEIFQKDYAIARDKLIERLDKWEQKKRDLNLSAEERLVNLDLIEAQRAILEDANTDLLPSIDRLSEIVSEQRAAKKAGDTILLDRLRKEKDQIEAAGGYKLRTLRKELSELNAREKTVDLSAAGLLERQDELLSKMADLEEANLRSMESLVRRGMALEKKLDQIGVGKLEEHIDKISSDYEALAIKAEASARRAKTTIENIRELAARSAQRDADAAAKADTESRVLPADMAPEKRAEAKAAREAATAKRTAAQEKILARLEKEEASQTALAERMRGVQEKLEAARAVDDDALLEEELRRIMKAERETSAMSLDRGAKIAALGERFGRFSPDRIKSQIAAIDEMRARQEQRFYDEWEVKKLGTGVDIRSLETPDFTEAATAVAREIFDKVTGRHHDSSRGVFTVKSARGASRDRTNMVRDEDLWPWLIQDARKIDEHLARVTGTDIEIKRAFGSLDLAEQKIRINNDYRRLSENVKAEAEDGKELPSLKWWTSQADRVRKEQARLESWRQRTIKDVDAMLSLLRDDYSTAMRDHNLARWVQGLKAFNYMRQMGGAVIANLGEPLRIATVHGLTPFVEVASASLRNVDALKFSRDELVLANSLSSRIMKNDVNRVADLYTSIHNKDPMLSYMEKATDVASIWNGMRIWESFVRRLSGATIQNRILRSVGDYANLSDRDKRWLALLDIDEARAKSIAAQFAEHGEEIDGILVAHSQKWDGRTANPGGGEAADALAEETRRIYYAAINKDLNSTIVRKSIADLPLHANTPLGMLLYQFNSFNIAAHQRVLMRGLQEGPARFISGLIAMTSMGMVVTYLQAIYNRRLDKLPNMVENPGWWVNAGLNNAGVFTILMTMSSMMGRMKVGDPVQGVLTAFDKGDQEAEKARGRPEIGQILGPTGALLQKGLQFGYGVKRASEGEQMTDAAWRAGFQTLPGSTFLGAKQGINYLFPPNQ